MFFLYLLYKLTKVVMEQSGLCPDRSSESHRFTITSSKLKTL